MMDVKLKMSRVPRAVPDIRAFVPVRRDPLEIEIDRRPEDVGDPGAIILPRSKEPLGIFEHYYCAKGGPVYNFV